MVAGLPGADRRALVKSVAVISPMLRESYIKCYGNDSFEANPNRAWVEDGIIYETSLSYFCVAGIVTILDDLIEEKL